MDGRECGFADNRNVGLEDDLGSDDVVRPVVGHMSARGHKKYVGRIGVRVVPCSSEARSCGPPGRRTGGPLCVASPRGVATSRSSATIDLHGSGTELVERRVLGLGGSSAEDGAAELGELGAGVVERQEQDFAFGRAEREDSGFAVDGYQELDGEGVVFDLAGELSDLVVRDLRVRLLTMTVLPRSMSAAFSVRHCFASASVRKVGPSILRPA